MQPVQGNRKPRENRTHTARRKKKQEKQKVRKQDLIRKQEKSFQIWIPKASGKNKKQEQSEQIWGKKRGTGENQKPVSRKTEEKLEEIRGKCKQKKSRTQC
jgi:hypothetical protein